MRQKRAARDAKAGATGVRAAASGRRTSAAPTLEIGSFERLDVPYLNPSIRSCQALSWFKDLLVVGTGRAPLGFLGRYTGRSDSLPGQEFSEFGSRDSDGAQIVVFDPLTRQWSCVFDSPTIAGADGKTRARDRSVRASIVCRTRADVEPALYLGVGSLQGKVVFLRSENGLTFEESRHSGFGIEGDLPSVRSFACMDGRLFTTPTGKNYDRGIYDDNVADNPTVFESVDPMSGEWTAASAPGFGDPTNDSVNELVVFNGHLYAATLNARHGFQVWKTDAEGRPPYRWRKVVTDGAWGGPVRSIAAAVAEFGGALYISSAIQRQGPDSLHGYGPFGAEIIRLWPDDRWEIVTGESRFTPQGLKTPITGLAGGFGDPFTHIFWRMAEYDGFLYAGTADWRSTPNYLKRRTDLSEAQMLRLRVDTGAYRKGAFALWRTADGVNWEAVTRTGFPGTNPSIFGVRGLAATPHGLFAGLTCRVGALSGGGIELWWGRRGTATRRGDVSAA